MLHEVSVTCCCVPVQADGVTAHSYKAMLRPAIELALAASKHHLIIQGSSASMPVPGALPAAASRTIRSQPMPERPVAPASRTRGPLRLLALRVSEIINTL